MTQNGNTDIIIGVFFFGLLRQVVNISKFFTFGHYNHTRVLTAFRSFVKSVEKFLHTVFLLRNQDVYRTGCNTGIQGDKTCVTSHNLNEEYPVVRGSGVANLIYRIHRCVESGIVSDGSVRAKYIIVYGPGNTNCLDAKFLIENLGSCKGSVPAYAYQSINAVFSALLKSFLPTFP